MTSSSWAILVMLSTVSSADRVKTVLCLVGVIGIPGCPLTAIRYGRMSTASPGTERDWALDAHRSGSAVIWAS